MTADRPRPPVPRPVVSTPPNSRVGASPVGASQVGAWLRTGTRLLAHPALWPTALRQAGRLAPAGWWRRPPFLPLPDPEYLRFRLETQYGSAPATDGTARRTADPDDVLTYLRWCRDQERLQRVHGRPGTRAGAGWPRR